MGTKSDVRKMEKQLREEGFVFVRMSKHTMIFKHPTHGFFVMPTPGNLSDERAMANKRAELKRRLR